MNVKYLLETNDGKLPKAVHIEVTLFSWKSIISSWNLKCTAGVLWDLEISHHTFWKRFLDFASGLLPRHLSNHMKDMVSTGPLKTKDCRFENFVITVGAVICRNNNLYLNQWWQICQMDNLLFSVSLPNHTVIRVEWTLNSLILGRCGCDLRSLIIVMSRIDIYSTCCQINLSWIPLNPNGDIWTFVKVMAWYHNATSHYLNQFWLRSTMPYAITRPQSVNQWAYFHKFRMEWVLLCIKISMK